MLGSQVSVLAIPLIAVLQLNAGPFELGILRAVSFLPTLAFGLVAGAWLDRVPRRPVMITADLARAVMLASLPAAALAGVLRLELLYAVALLTGAMSLLFDIAQAAWLPGALGTRNLVDANSKLELSRWTVQVAGPGAAGVLVQLIGAPFAIVADCASFAISATLLSRIDAPDLQASATHPRWKDAADGVRFIVADPLLRTLAVTAALSNLAAYAQTSVLLPYITGQLGLPATGFGLILSAFALGGVCGSVCGPRFRAIGAIITGIGLMAVGDAVTAASSGPILLVVGQFTTGFGLPIATISMISLRQASTPAHLLGRVSAATRVLAWSAIPFGALLGGLLGDLIGLRPALVASACGSALVLGWVCLSLRVKRGDRGETETLGTESVDHQLQRRPVA
jgi:MFS family permease